MTEQQAAQETRALQRGLAKVRNRLSHQSKRLRELRRLIEDQNALIAHLLVEEESLINQLKERGVSAP